MSTSARDKPGCYTTPPMSLQISRCRGAVLLAALGCAAVAGLSVRSQEPPRSVDWPSHGGDPGHTQSSTLDQITRENVGQLKVAWTYRTGDVND